MRNALFIDFRLVWNKSQNKSEKLVLINENSKRFFWQSKTDKHEFMQVAALFWHACLQHSINMIPLHDSSFKKAQCVFFFCFCFVCFVFPLWNDFCKSYLMMFNFTIPIYYLKCSCMEPQNKRSKLNKL